MQQRDPRVRDPMYLSWVAKLPCVACMVHGKVTWGVHVAHLRAGNPDYDKRPTGKAEKPSDVWVTPLCPPHHVGDSRAVKFSQHSMAELDFWATLGINPFRLCLDLRETYVAGAPAHPRQWGIAVITKAAAAGRRSIEGGNMNDEDRARAHYISAQAAGEIPAVALSIQQPWAWLMTRPVNGLVKTIENRNWLRKPPPSILVHAGLKVDADCHEALLAGVHPVTHEPWYDGRREYQRDLSCGLVHTGGFVGALDFTGDVLTESVDPWFMGRYGYVATNARQLPFLPWRGMLGFFAAKVTG